MEKIHIGNVNKKDLIAYAEIIRHELGFNSKEALSYLSRKGTNNMMTIKINQIPIGFINFKRRGGTLYINDFDIAKKQRSKGYGSLLLCKVEEKSIQKGVKKIRLHVSVDNKPAIKFYLNNKYIIEKQVKKFYAKKYDAFIISKTLTA